MQEKLSEVVLILIGSTLITLILAVLIVIAVYIGQKRKFRHRQELIEMKSTYEQEVLKTQLETQAQTFETISQELHDNVGTLISMAMMQLKGSSAHATEKVMQEADKLLDEAMAILRDISRSINPDFIHKMGLGQSIRNELDRLRKSKQFTTNYSSEGIEFSIDPQRQIIIFRIVQEALNNVIKHSGGDKVTVSVSFNEPSFAISIRDNGKGFLFKPDQGDLVNHSGLINMTKRARLIEGNLRIESEIDKGTLVQLEYPAQQAELSTRRYHKYGITEPKINTHLHYNSYD